jgi:nitrate reductase gamma subunit
MIATAAVEISGLLGLTRRELATHRGKASSKLEDSFIFAWMAVKLTKGNVTLLRFFLYSFI